MFLLFAHPPAHLQMLYVHSYLHIFYCMFTCAHRHNLRDFINETYPSSLFDFQLIWAPKQVNGRKNFTNGLQRTFFFPVPGRVPHTIPVWEWNFVAINNVSLFFLLRSSLIYEICAFNIKYLGLKIAWSFQSRRQLGYWSEILISLPP